MKCQFTAEKKLLYIIYKMQNGLHLQAPSPHTPHVLHHIYHTPASRDTPILEIGL